MKINLFYSDISKKNLSEFPFQFEISGGIPLPLNKTNYFTYGFFVSANVNLSSKKYFLKLELGLLGVNREIVEKYLFTNFENNNGYFFAGFSLQLFNVKEYKIFLKMGYGGYESGKEFVGGGSAGLKYLHEINNQFSITGNFKFPVIRDSFYDEYHYNPLITVGIPFF